MRNETVIGTIQELFISDKSEKKRINKEQISVDKSGVITDKFYNKDPNRSILISSIIAYDIIKKENISVKYGQLGENILVNFDPYSLNPGTQLYIGDVVLEITQECTICKLLNKIDKRVSFLLEKDRGIFAKVIHEGKLNKNDLIKIVN